MEIYKASVYTSANFKLLNTVQTMVTIKAESANYGINFPENVKELTPAILKQITTGINVPDNFVIVALAFKIRVFDFAVSINSKKDQNFGVVPLLAKTDDKSLRYLNAGVGDKLIIPRSALERGVHLNIPISISSDNAAMYFDTYKELATSIVRDNNIIKNRTIILLQFKIIPVTDISASQAIDNNIKDPFIVE